MKKIFLFLCGLIILTFAIPAPFYFGKKVHVSIDDVYECMKNVTEDSMKYESVFDEPFFLMLKNIHSRTGCKFTLYIYEKGKQYDISNFPYKFKSELNKQREWLQFGFHTISPNIIKDSIANFSLFTKSYESFLNNKIGGMEPHLDFISIMQLQKK